VPAGEMAAGSGELPTKHEHGSALASDHPQRSPARRELGYRFCRWGMTPTVRARVTI
jgi:hypothetical protein